MHELPSLIQTTVDAGMIYGNTYKDRRWWELNFGVARLLHLGSKKKRKVRQLLKISIRINKFFNSNNFYNLIAVLSIKGKNEFKQFNCLTAISTLQVHSIWSQVHYHFIELPHQRVNFQPEKFLRIQPSFTGKLEKFGSNSSNSRIKCKTNLNRSTRKNPSSWRRHRKQFEKSLSRWILGEEKK